MFAGEAARIAAAITRELDDLTRAGTIDRRRLPRALQQLPAGALTDLLDYDPADRNALVLRLAQLERLRAAGWVIKGNSARKIPTEFLQHTFLLALRVFGVIYRAARVVGIDEVTPYRWAATDPTFLTGYRIASLAVAQKVEERHLARALAADAAQDRASALLGLAYLNAHLPLIYRQNVPPLPADVPDISVDIGMENPYAKLAAAALPPPAAGAPPPVPPHGTAPEDDWTEGDWTEGDWTETVDAG